MKNPLPIPFSLKTNPANEMKILATVVLFAIIGFLKTVSFVFSTTADMIAYAANSDREKEWMPGITAITVLLLIARRIQMRVEAAQPVFEIKKDSSGSTEIKKEEPFNRGSDFAIRLRAAGQKGTLFAPPNTQNPSQPPSVSSTRPSTPTSQPKKGSQEKLDELAAELCAEVVGNKKV